MGAAPSKLTADARRAATIEAVVDLAGTANPSEITTAAIAGHMRLTQGALFRHFPTKEALWLAVMEWAADRMLGRLRAAAARETSPLAAMRAVFAEHFAFTVEHPGIPRLVFGELQRSGVSPAKAMARTMLQRYGAFLGELVEKGQAAGEIDAAVERESAVILFIGALQGLVMQSLLMGDPERIRERAHGAFAIYERGLGVSAEARAQSDRHRTGEAK